MRGDLFMRKLFFLCVIMIVIGGGKLVFGETSTETTNVYYEVVEIQKGDTVWSIAQSFMREEDNTKEYVDFILKFNHMSSAKILPGQNIIIPVYY